MIAPRIANARGILTAQAGKSCVKTANLDAVAVRAKGHLLASNQGVANFHDGHVLAPHYHEDGRPAKRTGREKPRGQLWQMGTFLPEADACVDWGII